MIKQLSSFIVLLLLTMILSVESRVQAGQHSGLGGTPPPTVPTPVPPEPSMFETVEQYLNSYYEWMRQQMEDAANQRRADIQNK